MTHDGVAQDRSVRPQPRWAARVASWFTVLAVVSFGVAAWQVGIWANHWYIAERVYYPWVDEAAKEGPYWDIAKLLESGNEALLNGFVCLAVAALAVAVAVLARRLAKR